MKLGTGGVSMIALKLARAMGCKVMISSSSDEKLRRVQERYSDPPTLAVNYASNKNWHKQVVELNGGIGVDLVLENGGATSLVRSLQATKRGGIVSQVGYLGKQDPKDLEELVPILIDRKTNLR
jgi:NADPH:quinone reductase-like Zn-dependent oxidoreductase